MLVLFIQYNPEKTLMKSFRKLSAPALLAIALFATSAISNATPFQIPGPGQDIPKNGTGPGNGNDDTSNFFRLSNIVTVYNLANPLTPLPTPINMALDLTSNDQSVGTPLAGFDYAVLHYGVGANGNQATGGGVPFYYLNGMTSFLFPANGLGPNGTGGFSSLTLFKSTNIPNVPDGGSTIMLLGA